MKPTLFCLVVHFLLLIVSGQKDEKDTKVLSAEDEHLQSNEKDIKVHVEARSVENVNNMNLENEQRWQTNTLKSHKPRRRFKVKIKGLKSKLKKIVGVGKKVFKIGKKVVNYYVTSKPEHKEFIQKQINKVKNKLYLKRDDTEDLSNYEEPVATVPEQSDDDDTIKSEQDNATGERRTLKWQRNKWVSGNEDSGRLKQSKLDRMKWTLNNNPSNYVSYDKPQPLYKWVPDESGISRLWQKKLIPFGSHIGGLNKWVPLSGNSGPGNSDEWTQIKNMEWKKILENEPSFKKLATLNNLALYLNNEQPYVNLYEVNQPVAQENVYHPNMHQPIMYQPRVNQPSMTQDEKDTKVLSAEDERLHSNEKDVKLHVVARSVENINKMNLENEQRWQTNTLKSHTKPRRRFKVKFRGLKSKLKKIVGVGKKVFKVGKKVVNYYVTSKPEHKEFIQKQVNKVKNKLYLKQDDTEDLSNYVVPIATVPEQSDDDDTIKSEQDNATGERRTLKWLRNKWVLGNEDSGRLKKSKLDRMKWTLNNNPSNYVSYNKPQPLYKWVPDESGIWQKKLIPFGSHIGGLIPLSGTSGSDNSDKWTQIKNVEWKNLLENKPSLIKLATLNNLALYLNNEQPHVNLYEVNQPVAQDNVHHPNMHQPIMYQPRVNQPSMTHKNGERLAMWLRKDQ